MSDAAPQNHRSLMRPANLAVLLIAALLLRIGVFLWGVLGLGVSPSRLAAGHDGAGYLELARAAARWDLASVSESVRRHDLGYPLFLAPLTYLPSAGVLAVVAGWGLALAAAAMLYRWATGTPGLGATPRQGLLMAAVVCVVYPTQLYYATFALTESLFMLLLLAALVSWSRGVGALRGVAMVRVVPYLLVGLAGALRAPGLLLGIAMLTVDLTRGFALRKVACAAVAPLPWLGTLALSMFVWGKTSAHYHKPTMSFPFSGFGAMTEVSPARAAYVCAAVALFVATVWKLAREAFPVRGHETAGNAGAADETNGSDASNEPAREFLRVGAVFAAAFVTFHLCLKTLYYEGNTIYTFNYQDRYLLPLLPLMAVAWRGALTPARIAAAACVAVALASYWLTNYVRAAGLTNG